MVLSCSQVGNTHSVSRSLCLHRVQLEKLFSPPQSSQLSPDKTAQENCAFFFSFFLSFFLSLSLLAPSNTISSAPSNASEHHRAQQSHSVQMHFEVHEQEIETANSTKNVFSLSLSLSFFFPF